MPLRFWPDFRARNSQVMGTRDFPRSEVDCCAAVLCLEEGAKAAPLGIIQSNQDQ